MRYKNCFFKIPILIAIFVSSALFLNSCHSQEKEMIESSTSSAKKVESSLPKNQTKSTFTEEIQATKPWRISVVVRDNIDLYQIDFAEGVIEGSKDFKIEHNLVYPPCPICAQEQIKQVNELINSGETDGIIINGSHSIRLVSVLEKAIDKGIPVIVVDTAVDSDRILTFVVFDNFTAAKKMGEWVSQKLGNKGNVLILNGFLGNRNAVDRLGGFLTGFQIGDIEVLDAQEADWDREKATLITRQWLKKFPEIDAIVAADDDMALAAANVISEANRKDILVTGFDATSEALGSINMGKMSATIDQIPKIQARLTLQLMIRHLEYGETFEPIITLSDVVLIDENYLQQQQNK